MAPPRSDDAMAHHLEQAGEEWYHAGGHASAYAEHGRISMEDQGFIESWKLEIDERVSCLQKSMLDLQLKVDNIAVNLKKAPKPDPSLGGARGTLPPFDL